MSAMVVGVMKVLCIRSDDGFSLSERHNPLVETDAHARRAEVRARHVEIVGDKLVIPAKCLLSCRSRLCYTRPRQRLSAFNQLLARIYQDDTLLYRAAS